MLKKEFPVWGFQLKHHFSCSFITYSIFFSSIVIYIDFCLQFKLNLFYFNENMKWDDVAMIITCISNMTAIYTL